MHPVIQKVEKFMRELGPIPVGRPILVGLSGGADSLALTLILKEMSFEVIAAHMNYQLRGEESDLDELFVTEFCIKEGISIYLKHVEMFDTSDVQGKGIQEKARNLRYAWFEELCTKENCAFIATGHHADDQAETVLFHLFRGSGMKGLAGIKPLLGNRIRPLLYARRSEIEDYLKARDQSWRTDSSNLKDDYSRNKIRHNIIPIATEINERAVEHISQTASIADEYRILAEKQIENWIENHCSIEENATKIPVEKLSAHDQRKSVLWYMLEPLGFAAAVVDEALSLLYSESGKGIRSEQFQIARDRDFLILKPLSQKTEVHVVISSAEETCEYLKITEVSGPVDFSGVSPFEAYFDAELLRFPLVLRSWKMGDRIIPLGMKGQQKISDLLIQIKVPLYKKQDVLVLESNGKIAWVVGLRVSEEFKITPKTERILAVESV
jgi:tRNA(Ile)-lysidine synthase